MALILTPIQVVIGDLHGRNTLAHQPTKLAAMEGLWDTTRGAPMTLIAWPDMTAERNLFAIEIPKVASLYLTHSWDGEVQGLKAVPRQDRPYVPIVFFAFRIMVGIALILLVTACTGAVLRLRGRLYETPWFLWLTMATTPLGFHRGARRLDHDRSRPTAVGRLRPAADSGRGGACHRACRSHDARDLLRRLQRAAARLPVVRRPHRHSRAPNRRRARSAAFPRGR